MRTFQALIVVLLLSGCDQPVAGVDRPRYETQANDQCLRRELFKECMAALPKGPERIHNSNDWSEVVDECDSFAQRTSVRQYSTIKPECRP